ncbi:hypothetical protein V7x_54890 [Crateriforma conspicua]|uniref:Uncharacterized protein n=1 Tax=Crateriforma conspicua TaxID=2527996 RepID=A0A5C6FGN1_9PLAN|nr:hypothetical protein [Crateriforma conspicua]TWU59715.1 hypothetical protein V7x_54890 [Crateriforma conspicua]
MVVQFVATDPFVFLVCSLVAGLAWCGLFSLVRNVRAVAVFLAKAYQDHASGRGYWG